MSTHINLMPFEPTEEELKKIEAEFEIDCPCRYIEDGLIDGCDECPYIEEDEEMNQAQFENSVIPIGLIIQEDDIDELTD